MSKHISKDIMEMIKNRIKEGKQLDYIHTLKISPKYEDRFRGKVYELELEIDNLDKLIQQAEKGEVYTKCSTDMLREQLEVMLHYVGILYERAKIEGVDLEKI